MHDGNKSLRIFVGMILQFTQHKKIHLCAYTYLWIVINICELSSVGYKQYKFNKNFHTSATSYAVACNLAKLSDDEKKNVAVKKE